MSDTLETGPQTIEEVLDLKYSEPDGPTEEVEEAAPDADQEVDVEGIQAEAETEEEIDETTDPEPEVSEEPQHLALDDFGDLTIPIIVNGVETKVNLTDAAKGYQLQADYSRKTAVLAEERKSDQAALTQERTALADKQRLLDEQLAQSMEREPDWVLMAQNDPVGFPVAKAKWDRDQIGRQQAMARSQQAQVTQSRDFQTKTADLAVVAMPEWANEGEFVKNADGRRDVALDAGFTEQEYDGSVDFRLAVLLEKASRYDAMKGQNAAVEKKLSKVPKVLKPGKSKSKGDVQAARKATINRKLDRPHSIDDALNAYMEGRAG